MKKLTYIFATAVFLLIGTASISAQSKSLSSLNIYPKNNSFLRDSLFWVKIDVKNPEIISYIDLYINNRSVGRDTRPPFRWGKGSDLRRGPKVLKPGSYKLKALIRTKDGKQTTKYSTFRVKGR